MSTVLPLIPRFILVLIPIRVIFPEVFGIVVVIADASGIAAAGHTRRDVSGDKSGVIGITVRQRYLQLHLLYTINVVVKIKVSHAPFQEPLLSLIIPCNFHTP